MKLSDKEIQEAIKNGKPIKRVAWGHGETVKHIKHAHVPARDKDKFKIEDTDIDDWVVC